MKMKYQISNKERKIPPSEAKPFDTAEEIEY
jgi:hypothetical protein